jgi:hypothetical protein
MHGHSVFVHCYVLDVESDELDGAKAAREAKQQQRTIAGAHTPSVATRRSSCSSSSADAARSGSL